MGTPAPQNSPDGISHFCWTLGYNFNPAPTKQLILVEFSGIEKTADWSPGDGAIQNSIFTLKQTAINPNQVWYSTDTALWIAYNITALLSAIEMYKTFDVFQFYASVANLCEYEFENEITENGINSFHKGTAKIWIEGFNL